MIHTLYFKKKSSPLSFQRKIYYAAGNDSSLPARKDAMQKKIYILDTNVLIHDPKAIENFSNATVGIPFTAIEELDQFKNDLSQRGMSAREVIRQLDKLRAHGSLRKGVALEHGGILKILMPPPATRAASPLTLYHKNDNKIIETALQAKKEKYTVELVTKDLNMRIKADAVGIVAVDYLKNTVSKEEYYRGWHTIQVPAVQLKGESKAIIEDTTLIDQLLANEYVIAEAQHNPHNYRLFRADEERHLHPTITTKFPWNIVPRNIQQHMALDLLLDDNVQLVTLSGPAGTGKTLLVLIAALYKVLVEKRYAKLFVSRPLVPLGPDVGYLPGELEDKLYNWMQPIYDNIELIDHLMQESQQNLHELYGVHQQKQSEHQDASEHQRHMKPDKYEHMHKGYHRSRGKNKHRYDTSTGPHPAHDTHSRKGPHKLLSVEQLVAQDKLSLEAITFMRGRSIPFQYIFIDEVQNLTPHEVKTIVSRVGQNSKIVLAGDPFQIDSPYLDFSSNGLMVLTEKFKGQPIFGSVFLEKSERSMISKLASELL